MSKDFRIKDKSGRDGIAYVQIESLLQQENEEDWNGKLLHDFVEESDIGDTWETHNIEIECILNEEDKEDIAEIPLRVIKQTLDALWFNFSPYLDEIEDCDKEWVYDAIDAYNALLAHTGETEGYKVLYYEKRNILS